VLDSLAAVAAVIPPQGSEPDTIPWWLGPLVACLLGALVSWGLVAILNRFARKTRWFLKVAIVTPCPALIIMSLMVSLSMLASGRNFSDTLDVLMPLPSRTQWLLLALILTGFVTASFVTRRFERKAIRAGSDQVETFE